MVTPANHVTHGEMIDLIGVEALIALAEKFGGTRLYIPQRVYLDCRILKLVGTDAARKLSERYGRTMVKVPLARELRATHYREQGLSNAKIAVRFGMTETGVERLFQRIRDGGVNGCR